MRASGPSRREQLAYALGSLAVVWIAASMLVAAAPGSHTMAKVYPVFQPFIDAVDLEHDWGFFAPDPGTGHMVRYEVRDAAGEIHPFGLTEELDRWEPAYFRRTTLYTNASVSDRGFMTGAVRFLCRRHAELEPQAIRIVVAHQIAVTPQEYREGFDTMDGLEISHRKWRACEEDGA